MKYRKKFIFVVLILAIVLAAGCTGRPTEECINPLVKDEKCIQSQASPTPTATALVVKSAEVNITPIPTETMPTIAESAKETQWHTIDDKPVKTDFGKTTVNVTFKKDGTIEALLSNTYLRDTSQTLRIKFFVKDSSNNQFESPIYNLGASAIGARLGNWRTLIGDADIDRKNVKWKAEFKISKL